MWKFFQGLGVIDAQGNPTEHFGDPTWVYVAYARRKGDQRAEDELRREARQRIDVVRERGVFIAEGYSQKVSELPAKLERQIHEIYDDAKQCIWAELPQDFESKFPDAIAIETQSTDRNDYILHPSTGEELNQASIEKVAAIRHKHGQDFDTVLIVSDGLNALANTTEFQAESLIASLRKQLTDMGVKVYPETFIVRSGRVRAGYRIGENLFGQRDGQYQVLHVVGERPGSGHRTLSIYITRAVGLTWGVPSKVDHNITKVVSGIAKTALSPEQGAEAAVRILRTMV
jgi:ethanolamine ammonia-lyase large subunit